MKKVVVITGAASGIGRALAELYLKSDATVVALDLNVAGLSGFRGTVYKVDVSHPEELQSIGEQIVRETRCAPSVWINSAGIAKLGHFSKMDLGTFNQVMSVNFNGTVNGTRTALALMKDAGSGVIVNLASVSGFLPAPFMSAYTASKHAVAGFTRSVRMELEWSRSKIKMILVWPGFVRTPMIETQPGFQLPKWMDFMVSSAELTSKKIFQGIRRGQKEIYPTPMARVLLNLNRIAPECSSPLSRLTLAKNWRQLVGLDEIGSE